MPMNRQRDPKNVRKPPMDKRSSSDNRTFSFMESASLSEREKKPIPSKEVVSGLPEIKEKEIIEMKILEPTGIKDLP